MRGDHSRRRMAMPVVQVALVTAVALLLAGCSDGGSAAAEQSDPTESSGAGSAPDTEARDSAPAGDVFPGEDWETTDAESAGMDPAVLEVIAADAGAGLSNCLLVTRGGRLVDEWYWQGTRPTDAQEVFSASKSFTSVLMGMAADDGAFEVTDHASRWIPEWRGTPSENVTVEQLLNNTSGRHYEFRTDYVEMAGMAADKTAFAIGLDQQHEPGTEWVYNNSAIQTLEQVFEGSTGADMADFADERLFESLGMHDSSIIRDEAGNPLTFMGVQSTCRDMARFGLMALHHGNWDGEQVVSEDWMRHSTGGSSQDLNAAYGWLWWVNERGTVLDDEQAAGETADDDESQLVEGAPDEMFFALGLGGQMIAVDPNTETVVVRLGESTYPEGTERFETSDIVRVVTEAVVD